MYWYVYVSNRHIACLKIRPYRRIEKCILYISLSWTKCVLCHVVLVVIWCLATRMAQCPSGTCHQHRSRNPILILFFQWPRHSLHMIATLSMDLGAWFLVLYVFFWCVIKQRRDEVQIWIWQHSKFERFQQIRYTTNVLSALLSNANSWKKSSF